MSMNTNQLGIVTKAETTSGTFIAPIASDSDVIIFGTGQPTIAFNNSTLGKLADGSFGDAPVAGGMQTLTLPDYSMELRHSDTVDGTVEPKSWKDAKACGAKVDASETQLALVFDGTASCYSNSCEVLNLACNGSGVKYTGRGMRGNITITADGANAPLLMNITGLTGALVGKTDVVSQAPYTVVGNDTEPVEKMARYVTTIGSTVYQVSNHEFNAGFTTGMEPANNEQGIAKTKLTGEEMRLKLTLVQLVTGDVVYDDAKNNTVYNEITLVGGVGAGYDITYSLGEHLDPSIGDIDGTTGWDIELVIKQARFKMKDLT